VTARDPLHPDRVIARLRQAADMFRWQNADQARAAMEGRLASDGVVGAANDEPFAVAVARRLEVLRALDRRRRALASAHPSD